MSASLELALRDAHRAGIERDQRIRELEADLETARAEAEELRDQMKAAERVDDLGLELRDALTRLVGALQYAQLATFEVERQLALPLPGGDEKLAERFEKLRLTMTRAEAAATKKLKGEG